MTFLLISALLYAFNNLLWKLLLIEEKSIIVIWARSVFTSSIGITCLLVSEENPVETVLTALGGDLYSYLFASLSGGVGLWAMVQGIQKSSLTYFSLFQALITVLSGIGLMSLMDVSVNSLVGVGTMLIAYAVHVISSKEDGTGTRAAGWLVLMAIAFTVSGFLNWPLVQKHPVMVAVTFQEVFIFLLSSLVLGMKITEATGSLRKWAPRYALFGVIITAAIYFGDRGLKITDPFLLSTVGLIAPVLTSLLGLFLLREKWHWSYLISILLILLGFFILYS